MITTLPMARQRWRLRLGLSCGERPYKAKVYVIRQMFAVIEADAYLLVDGDDTYDADAAPETNYLSNNVSGGVRISF